MAAGKGILLSAGAGALVAMAGIYFARKASHYFSRKPKMRLVRNNLLLSTRCSWLLAELGVEDEFQINLPADSDRDNSCYSKSSCFVSELDLLSGLDDREINRPLVRQEDDYQVVKYSPYVSQEDLTLPSSFNEDCSDYGSQGSTPPPIPTCVINDEFTMIEGAAICMYLADVYGVFLPKPEHRAEYYSWIVYSAATFDDIVKNIYVQMVEMPESQRNTDRLDSALGGFNAFARALSETLSNTKYLCGNSFTAADCVLGFTLWWAYTIDHGKLLDGYPVLLAYLDRLQRRPAFQKTFSCYNRLEDVEHSWEWGRYFMACLEQTQE